MEILVLIVIIAAIHLIIALFSAISAIEYVSAPPLKSKRRPMRPAFAGLALAFLLIPGAAMAQDVAKVDEKPAPKSEKALPARVTLTDETDRVRMVQLRLTAIVNESQILRERLAKLEEAVKREQADLNVAIVQAMAKHGLKPEDLPKYDFRNVEPLDTGPIVLVKKADVPDTPKAETGAKKSQR